MRASLDAPVTRTAWLGLAHEEATRVEEQAANAWAALPDRLKQGAPIEGPLQLLNQSSQDPRNRLLNAYRLLEKAKACRQVEHPLGE